MAKLLKFNDESQWLAWRLNGIGASSAATLFDVNPFESRLDLWKKIRNAGARKKIESSNMRKGKDLEDLLFPELKRVFKIDIQEQMCIQHPQKSYLRATLDGINVDHACIWEMKFISDYQKYLAVRAIPMAHKLQIQQQLLICEAYFPTAGTGRQWKAFYIYSNGIGPNGIDWRVIEEAPDLEMQQDILDKSELFWNTNVLQGIAPEALPLDAIERDDEPCLSRCERLKVLQNSIEEAEAIKQELKDMGGDTPFRCSGVNYSFNTKLSGARYKDICQLPCVIKALKDNGLTIDDFRDPPVVQKRIWFD